MNIPSAGRASYLLVKSFKRIVELHSKVVTYVAACRWLRCRDPGMKQIRGRLKQVGREQKNRNMLKVKWQKAEKRSKRRVRDFKDKTRKIYTKYMEA